MISEEQGIDQNKEFVCNPSWHWVEGDFRIWDKIENHQVFEYCGYLYRTLDPAKGNVHDTRYTIADYKQPRFLIERLTPYKPSNIDEFIGVGDVISDEDSTYFVCFGEYINSNCTCFGFYLQDVATLHCLPFCGNTNVLNKYFYKREHIKYETENTTITIVVKEEGNDTP